MPLKPLGAQQGYVKAGIFGFQGSGKSYTAVEMAIGIREFFGLKGPIAVDDTESAFSCFEERVKKRTGTDMVGDRTRSFDQLMALGHDCVKEKVSVLIVDSITHIWRELGDAHLAAINETAKQKGWRQTLNLEFQHWGPIKRKWEKWTQFYLNSPLHIIICGRAGYEYAHEENEQTRKKDLVKVGTKMKAEAEFGFEPSLLIEMERIENQGETYRLATVVKDRWDVIDGKQMRNPTFEFFKPHVERLKPGAHVVVDTQSKSKTELDDLGHDDHDRRRKARDIVLEEIKGEMLKRWPSTGGAHQKLKGACLETVFGTLAWAKVEILPYDELKMGLTLIRNMEVPDSKPAATKLTEEQP